MTRQANIGSGQYVDRVETTAIVPTVSFTRPADTTAYAAGDLIANSTTAGSVVPLAFPVKSSGMVVRARLDWGSTAALSWRLHLFTVAPTVSAGDNAAFAAAVAAGGYLGALDWISTQVIGTRSFGIGVPSVGAGMAFGSEQQTLFGLIESRGAYTPTSAESFVAALEVI
jgi:hypothetical protein